jgi:hypothetical protein
MRMRFTPCPGGPNDIVQHGIARLPTGLSLDKIRGRYQNRRVPGAASDKAGRDFAAADPLDRSYYFQD